MSHKLKQTLTAHNSSALNFINVRMSPRSAELRLDKDFLSVLDIFFSLLGSIKLKSCFAPSICSLNLEILFPLLSKIESIHISFIYTSVLKMFWQRRVLPKKYLSIWVLLLSLDGGFSGWNVSKKYIVYLNSLTFLLKRGCFWGWLSDQHTRWGVWKGHVSCILQLLEDGVGGRNEFSGR